MYEDVIPVHFYDKSKVYEVLSFLGILPVSNHDKVTVFIAWSSDVGYLYTVADLNVLRSS